MLGSKVVVLCYKKGECCKSMLGKLLVAYRAHSYHSGNNLAVSTGASGSCRGAAIVICTAHVRLYVIVAVVVLASITGVAGGLYPAFYAIRLRAVEALRFE